MEYGNHLNEHIPKVRTFKDMIISHIGSLLKYENRIGRPRIGDSINGKYKATVRPMNPTAIICIHKSYKANKVVTSPEMFDRVIPIKRNANDNLETTRVYLYLARFSPLLSFKISLMLNPAKILRAHMKATVPTKNEERNKTLTIKSSL